ncbi:Transcription termination protein NusA [hydrothermal vent metagenome]|uniref:Transcription termination protein NusA n=1 Tax=hydrothermal vent metagenome TaxID=652676 RepID=A0A1W1BI87_9ZZZZ
MEKIIDIIEAIAHEKSISKEDAIDAFKMALTNTAKRLTSKESTFEINIDMDTRDYSVSKIITVVADGDERLETHHDSFMALTEAYDYDSEIEVGDELRTEFVLEEYGRTAAANLFRELEYHVQRRIEQNLFDKYRALVDTVMIGIVNRVDAENNTHVEIGELKGILTQRNRIKGEVFKRGDTMKALLRFVTIDPEYGMFLELTRTSPKFLEKLMAKEVPEIEDGMVEIMSTARIPGERAKIALRTDHMNIDAIGAAVGVRGVRINAVSKELNGENIDCIEYSAIPEIFITRSLSPAITQNIKLEDKNAIINITKDQKAKAIGRSGINIRLASMLTKYNIDLNEVEGITDRTSNSKDNKESVKTTDTTALADLFK